MEKDKNRDKNDILDDVTTSEYKHGFVTEIETDIIPEGLDEDIIRLISQKKAHHAFNFDDDEEQNEEDYALVVEAQKAQEAANSASIWGDMNDGTEVMERGV